MVETTNINELNDNPSLEEEANAQGITIETNSNEEKTTTETLELNTGEELQETNEGEAEPEETPEEPEETKELSEHIQTSDNTLIQAKDDLEAKGVKFDEIVSEYETTGTVSEKTIELLEKNGYPKAVVDVYLQSRQAIDQQFVNEVYRMSGGEEEYAKMMSWATGNLPKSVSASFNKAVDSNDISSVSLMLEGIKARMVATQGTANPAILGASAPKVPQTKGFSTKTEMIQAMSDKRYGIDSKYTRSVEERMSYTKF